MVKDIPIYCSIFHGEVQQFSCRNLAGGESFPQRFFAFSPGFPEIFDHRHVQWGKVFHTFNRVFNIFNVDNPYTLWITVHEYTLREQGMNRV